MQKCFLQAWVKLQKGAIIRNSSGPHAKCICALFLGPFESNTSSIIVRVEGSRAPLALLALYDRGGLWTFSANLALCALPRQFQRWNLWAGTGTGAGAKRARGAAAPFARTIIGEVLRSNGPENDAQMHFAWGPLEFLMIAPFRNLTQACEKRSSTPRLFRGDP